MVHAAFNGGHTGRTARFSAGDRGRGPGSALAVQARGDDREAGRSAKRIDIEAYPILGSASLHLQGDLHERC